MSLFRDLTVHAYFEVSINRVWKVFKDDLQKIKEALNKVSLV